MSLNIIRLFLIMCSNLVIELPLTYLFFRKRNKGKYILEVSFLINCITNLIINIIVLLFFSTGLVSLVGELYIDIFLCEIFVVILPEAFVYYKAFNGISYEKSVCYSLILNVFSYIVGLMLFI